MLCVIAVVLFNMPYAVADLGWCLGTTFVLVASKNQKYKVLVRTGMMTFSTRQHS